MAPASRNRSFGYICVQVKTNFLHWAPAVYNSSMFIGLLHSDSPLYLRPFLSILWAWNPSDLSSMGPNFWGGIRESVWLKSRRNESACSHFMAFPDTTRVGLSNDRLFIGQNHPICTFLLPDTMEMTSTHQPATRPACCGVTPRSKPKTQSDASAPRYAFKNTMITSSDAAGELTSGVIM